MDRPLGLGKSVMRLFTVGSESSHSLIEALCYLVPSFGPRKYDSITRLDIESSALRWSRAFPRAYSVLETENFVS